ncbi:fibrocystin [Platysternon megacephalum]|uniref:Fibrocystin n=1 Tax=Platysternon megacephalum TaxID=55544 RepID=A0A4D9ECY8_9SAUR|nr:fibrocystin [Platysternon megacephalum]
MLIFSLIVPDIQLHFKKLYLSILLFHLKFLSSDVYILQIFIDCFQVALLLFLGQDTLFINNSFNLSSKASLSSFSHLKQGTKDVLSGIMLHRQIDEADDLLGLFSAL